MLTINHVVIQSGSAVVAEINGEVVALDATKGTCYGLNGVATRVWNLISSPHSVREICDTLLQEYDVEAATCEQQVLELLEDLRNEGLLEITHSVPQSGSGAPSEPAAG
jgi:hypothetical protein